MNDTSEIILHLLESEEEDDFNVKDVTEPELLSGPATVKRFGRMKLVDTPQYTFLISYLTPVAYYDKNFGTYYESTKNWSPTTNDHIGYWQKMIWKSPEWQADPKNKEAGEYGGYVRYPRFKRRPQAKITELFRKMLPLMVMKPHQKRRLYHVDPQMRKGSTIDKTWLSAHLKHHDTGSEGLPKPNDRDFGEFFKDFDPDEPEIWSWQNSGLRNQEPYERYKPDEE